MISLTYTKIGFDYFDTAHVCIHPSCFQHIVVIDAPQYVAMRDIWPGEEVLLDYGADWSQSWEDHREKWKGTNDPLYLSASTYTYTQW